jgi:hypothetical protein
MIKLEKDIHPLESLSLQDFSYSRLSTFIECSLKYYYSYIIKEPQEFGHAATLGNIIHKALEITIEDGQAIDLSELLMNYKAARFEYDHLNEIPDTMIENGEAMLRDYVVINSGEQKVFAKELAFSFVLNHARFNGYIDYVAVYEDYVHVRDYKSGAREVAAKNVPNDLQLGIYSLYMKYLYPDKDIYAELYYLKSGRLKGHRFSDDDLLAVESKLNDLSELVLTTDNFTPTADESKCNWCSYAKNGVCSIGQQRLRRRSPGYSR